MFIVIFMLTGYRKHDIPSLNDDVWRLKNISKDGPLYDALRGSGILCVKDFLRLYYKDQQALRTVRQEFLCVPSHSNHILLNIIGFCYLPCI